jgi:hypothetical protein
MAGALLFAVTRDTAFHLREWGNYPGGQGIDSLSRALAFVEVFA